MNESPPQAYTFPPGSLEGHHEPSAPPGPGAANFSSNRTKVSTAADMHDTKQNQQQPPLPEYSQQQQHLHTPRQDAKQPLLSSSLASNYNNYTGDSAGYISASGLAGDSDASQLNKDLLNSQPSHDVVANNPNNSNNSKTLRKRNRGGNGNNNNNNNNNKDDEDYKPIRKPSQPFSVSSELSVDHDMTGVTGNNNNNKNNNNNRNGRNVRGKGRRGRRGNKYNRSNRRGKDGGKECCCARLVCRSCRDFLCFLVGAIIALGAGAGAFYLYLQLTTDVSTSSHATVPTISNFSNYSSGSSYAYITWDAAKSNGATISKYLLEYRKTPETMVNYEVNTTFDTLNVPYNGMYRNYNHTGLRGDNSYDYRVCACNAVGCSNFSDILTIYTMSPTVPESPTAPYILSIQTNVATSNNLNDNKTSSNAISIGFTDSSDGGAVIQYFEVYYSFIYSATNSSNWKFFCNTTNIASYEFLDSSQVYNCTNYSSNNELSSSGIIQYRTRAKNYVGFSEYSKSTPCVLPVNDLDYFMCSVPNPPDALEYPSDIKYVTQPYSIILEWDEPNSQSSILGYEILTNNWWNHTGLFNATLNDNGLSRYVQFDNLLPGVPYDYDIRSYNRYGYSDWTGVFSISTNETGACGNLNDLTIQKDNYDTLQSTITKIFASCLAASDRDSCAQQALEDQLGFSAACAECWVDDGNCSMKKCISQCVDLSSSKCIACSEEYCFPETVTCTGLPMWTFPK